MSGLLLAWLAGFLIWLADGRPARDAASWPLLATTDHMSFDERRALHETMRRGGAPVRIGDVWYRFPEGVIRSRSIRRADQYAAYYGTTLYVDMSGLVRGWPPDRDAALVGIGSRPTEVAKAPACPAESRLIERLRKRDSRWPSCSGRWEHRGNAVWVRYPLPAQDHLSEMKASLELLLDQYVVEE